MKKILFVCMLSLVTVFGMAQHHHHDDHGHSGPGPRGGHGGRHVIECATSEQMRMALNVLDDLSFDDKRLEVANLCVVLGHFCTDDLARIAQKFSFDDNRKKFLIFAHDYCEDPQNYYYLHDVFDFESNFEDMMKAVMPGYRR